MIVIRAILAAMGSGGGVAWSTFGIISAALSLAIACTTSIILGAVCSSLFLLISSSVLYLSYRDHLERREKIDNKLRCFADELVNELDHFLHKMHQQYKCQSSEHLSFKDYLLTSSYDFKEKNARILIKNLLEDNRFDLKTIFNLEPHQRKLLLSVCLLDATKNELINCMPPTSKEEFIRTALFGFVGGFGAIAGCTSGFVGMLFGIGVFAGFSALPLLGLITLAVAATVATFMAIKLVQIMKEENEIKHFYQGYRALASDIREISRSLVENNNESHKISSRPQSQRQPTAKRHQSLDSNPAHFDGSLFNQPKGYRALITEEKNSLLSPGFSLN